MYSAALAISPSASTVESPVSITCVTPWSRGFGGRCGRSRKSGTAETLLALNDLPGRVLIAHQIGRDGDQRQRDQQDHRGDRVHLGERLRLAKRAEDPQRQGRRVGA